MIFKTLGLREREIVMNENGEALSCLSSRPVCLSCVPGRKN